MTNESSVIKTLEEKLKACKEGTEEIPADMPKEDSQGITDSLSKADKGGLILSPEESIKKERARLEEELSGGAWAKKNDETRKDRDYFEDDKDLPKDSAYKGKDPVGSIGDFYKSDTINSIDPGKNLYDSKDPSDQNNIGGTESREPFNQRGAHIIDVKDTMSSHRQNETYN